MFDTLGKSIVLAVQMMTFFFFVRSELEYDWID